jgi:hypothetical protein
MKLATRVTRWGLARAATRLGRSVPLAGAALVVAALGVEVKRKGLFGGVLETVLNATPFIGALKNAVEMVRGDFIPDKRVRSEHSLTSNRRERV